MAVVLKSKSDNTKNVRKNAVASKINNPKGRGAEKLKLDMDFDEAVKKMVNTKIVNDKKV